MRYFVLVPHSSPDHKDYGLFALVSETESRERAAEVLEAVTMAGADGCQVYDTEACVYVKYDRLTMSFDQEDWNNA